MAAMTTLSLDMPLASRTRRSIRLRAGRDAAEGPRELRPGRRRAAAGDDAGDMRAVAVIVRVCGCDEALAVYDARRQVGVRVDSAIDDGYADARSGVSGLVGESAPEAAALRSTVPATGRSGEM